MGRGGYCRTFAFSPREPRPRLCSSPPSSKSEGAGNAGCWLHPRPPRGTVAQKRALTKQVQPRHPGIPCAVVLRLIRALLGEPDFVVTVISAMRMHHRQLGASHGAPGPHDFVVRTHAARLATARVHRIPHPAYVTFAIRPSERSGMRERYGKSEFLKSRIFLHDRVDRIFWARARRANQSSVVVRPHSGAAPSIEL